MLEGAIFGLFTKEDIKGRDGKVLMEAETLIEHEKQRMKMDDSFKADLPKWMGPYRKKKSMTDGFWDIE